MIKGKKFDNNKIPCNIPLQEFPRVIEALAACAKYGHDKYETGDDWSNWSKVENGIFRYQQAEVRHKLNREKGVLTDIESGLPHEFHELWNKCAQLELKLRENEKNAK